VMSAEELAAGDRRSKLHRVLQGGDDMAGGATHWHLGTLGSRAVAEKRQGKESRVKNDKLVGVGRYQLPSAEL
jgi:hypothetical protein